MRVSQVMTRNAECIKPDASVQEAAKRMKSLDVGALPVCDNDRLVGVITDRDIAVRSAAEGRDPKADRVQATMTPELVYCFEDEDAADAARRMQEKQIRRLPVLNRDKRLVGIVSLGDLAVEARDDKLSGETLERVSEPAKVKR